jgi:hypothetical protein
MSSVLSAGYTFSLCFLSFSMCGFSLSIVKELSRKIFDIFSDINCKGGGWQTFIFLYGGEGIDVCVFLSMNTVSVAGGLFFMKYGS